MSETFEYRPEDLAGRRHKFVKPPDLEVTDLEPGTPLLCEFELCSVGYLMGIVNHNDKDYGQLFYSKTVNEKMHDAKEALEHLVENERAVASRRKKKQTRRYRTTPQVLLCPIGEVLDFRLLIEVIRRLHRLRNAMSSAPGEEIIRQACQAFTDALGGDCWTAYTRNRRVNRSYHFGDGGLLAPQATHGFLMKNDLPTRRLFRSTDLLELVPESVGGPAGTFRRRENIERSVSVRVESDRLTFVLFVNWRTSGERKGLATEVWRKLEWSDGSSPPLRFLEPAARYFAGWLIGANPDVRDDHRVESNKSAMLLRDVLDTAIQPDNFTRLAFLEQAIKRSLPFDQDHMTVRVHHVDGGAVVVRDAARILDVADLAEQYLRPDGSARFPIQAAKPQLRVEKSIAAQAVAWKTSLLIDFDELAQKGPGQATEMDRHFLGIRVARRETSKTRYELAVPIYDERDDVEAVVSLTEKDELTTDHVRRAELIVQLHRKVIKLRDCADEPVQGFFRLLEEKAHHGSSYRFQHAAQQLNTWVRLRLGADLVYLLIYDARHDVFRAMGISTSLGLFRHWLDHPHELENILVQPGGDGDSEAVRGLLQRVFREGAPTESRRPDDTSINVLRPFLHRVMEHSIIARLRPRGSSTRSRGLSWQILNGTERPPFFYPTESRVRVNFDAATRYYSKFLYARPFATDRDARADGVLWVGWCQEPRYLVTGPDNGLPDPDLEKHVQAVEQAVAAIFSLYQYYDPDDAHHPLPFHPPKAKTSRPSR